MKLRTRTTVIILFLTAVALQVCSAQQFWEKKPYREWSPKEVNQMLQNSPWAITTTIGTVSTVMPNRSGRRAQQSLSDDQGESMPRIEYLVQFRSATPMRHAVARKSLLDAKYDSLDATHKADLDKRIETYLS